MAIAILNKEENEIIKMLRAMPEKAKKAFIRKIEEMREEIEDEKDIKDIIKRAKEPTIPADKVFAKLGF